MTMSLIKLNLEKALILLAIIIPCLFILLIFSLISTKEFSPKEGHVIHFSSSPGILSTPYVMYNDGGSLKGGYLSLEDAYYLVDILQRRNDLSKSQKEFLENLENSLASLTIKLRGLIIEAVFYFVGGLFCLGTALFTKRLLSRLNRDLFPQTQIEKYFEFTNYLNKYETAIFAAPFAFWYLSFVTLTTTDFGAKVFGQIAVIGLVIYSTIMKNKSRRTLKATGMSWKTLKMKLQRARAI